MCIYIYDIYDLPNLYDQTRTYQQGKILSLGSDYLHQLCLENLHLGRSVEDAHFVAEVAVKLAAVAVKHAVGTVTLAEATVELAEGTEKHAGAAVKQPEKPLLTEVQSPPLSLSEDFSCCKIHVGLIC